MHRKLTDLKQWHENVRSEVKEGERKATRGAGRARDVIGALFGEIVTLGAVKKLMLTGTR